MGTLRSGVVRMARMDADERRVHLEAVVEVARARRRLRTSRHGSLLDDGVQPPGAAHGTEPDAVDERALRLVGTAVGRAAKVVPGGRQCLVQAMAIDRMLRRRGVHHAVHIGVTGSDGFAAHAWVTVGDTLLGPSTPTERYTRLVQW